MEQKDCISIINRELRQLEASIVSKKQAYFYNISYKGRIISRRFSEFKQLRLRLIQKFCDKPVFIPELPESFQYFSWWYDTQQQNLNLRQKILESFLRKLQVVKQVWEDSQVENFLSDNKYEENTFTEMIKTSIRKVSALDLQKIKNYGMAFIMVNFNKAKGSVNQYPQNSQKLLKKFTELQSLLERNIAAIYSPFEETEDKAKNERNSKTRESLEQCQLQAKQLKILIRKTILSLYSVKNELQYYNWLKFVNENISNKQEKLQDESRLAKRMEMIGVLSNNFEQVQMLNFKKQANQLVINCYKLLYSAF